MIRSEDVIFYTSYTVDDLLKLQAERRKQVWKLAERDNKRATKAIQRLSYIITCIQMAIELLVKEEGESTKPTVVVKDV